MWCLVARELCAKRHQPIPWTDGHQDLAPVFGLVYSLAVSCYENTGVWTADLTVIPGMIPSIVPVAARPCT